MASTGEAWRLGRRPALDGLRGVAALVVVVHHALLLSPAIARFYDPSGPRAHWVTYTPLRLLWAGEVAVAVFFVLSGYVLARPFLAGRGSTWRAYYSKRLVRLYLPVWAAVALAATLLELVPRSASTGRSWWVDMQAMSVSVHSIVRNLVLLGGTDQLDNPLWSLRWEVVFSLALPVYVALVVLLRRYPLVVSLAATLSMTMTGVAVGSDAMRYLPVFALGALLADREAELRTWTHSLASSRWCVATAAAVLLMTPRNYTLQVVGAALLVGVVLVWGGASRVLATRLPLWLGKVSFSLYLVHVPLLVALSALLASEPVVVVAPLGLGSALVVSVLFHRYVEAPSVKLARSCGRREVRSHQVILNQSTA